MNGLNQKIAFTGPESSGKTTLAKWLSSYLNIPFSEEYARTYLLQNRGYSKDSLDIMAQVQFDQNEKVEICDTEMLVFVIWSLEKYGSVSPLIEHLLGKQTISHYFLCAPDIPWEDDPLRENPYDRERLFELYSNYLTKHNFSYSIIRGSLEERKTDILLKLDMLKNR